MSKNSRTAQASTFSTQQIVADLEAKVKAVGGQLQKLNAEKNGFEDEVRELLAQASKLRLRLTDKGREIENRESDLTSLKAQLATAQEAEQKRKQAEEAARIGRTSAMFDALVTEAQRLNAEARTLDVSITEIADAIEVMTDTRVLARNRAFMAELQAEQKEFFAKAKDFEDVANRLMEDVSLLPQAEQMLASLTGQSMPAEESDTVIEISDDDDEEESIVDASVFNNNAGPAVAETASAPEFSDLLAVKVSGDAKPKGAQKAVQPIARPAARPAPQTTKPAVAPQARRPTAEEAQAVRREIARLAQKPLPKPLKLEPQPPRRLQTINNPQPKDVAVREISVGGKLMRIVSADVSGLGTNAPLFRPPHNADVAIAGHHSKKNPDTEWVIGIHPRRDVARLIIATIKAKLRHSFTAKGLVVKLMESDGSLYLNIQVEKEGDRPLKPEEALEALSDGSGFEWIGEPPKRQPSAKPAPALTSPATDTAPSGASIPNTEKGRSLAPPVEDGKAAGLVASSTELAVVN